MSFMEWRNNRREKEKQREENHGLTTDAGRNVEKLSRVGSIRSTMSQSAADKKLEALQAEVVRLDKITIQQAETISRLQDIIARLQIKRK
jgi:hypothetical protein